MTEPNVSTDRELILAIARLLDGTEWSSSTLSEIAELLVDAGYTIRDCNEMLPPASKS